MPSSRPPPTRERLRPGRNVLVLTQWTDHLDALATQLQRQGVEPLVLKGGPGKKARAAVIDQLNADPAPTGQLLLATGSYLSEGFDSPSLDTLFLAFPLAFKGRVVQYIGRILRTNNIKTNVEVHDYLDPGPVFRKMHSKTSRHLHHPRLRRPLPPVTSHRRK